MKEKPDILVVDDDMAHRTMLKALLGRWNYDITEADDGSTAIEKVKERSFDLILMDIRMVKVSGIEALDKIKAYNPSIPIIIMTAYSSLETAIETLKKGALKLPSIGQWSISGLKKKIRCSEKHWADSLTGSILSVRVRLWQSFWKP